MADRKSTIYDLEAEKIKEKIIIFAADTGGYTQKEVSLEIQASLDELTELIDTAGAEVVGRLVQNRDRMGWWVSALSDLQECWMIQSWWHLYTMFLCILNIRGRK